MENTLSFLKSLIAPQELKFSHTLVDRMLKTEFSDNFLLRINKKKSTVIDLFTALVKFEDRFNIAKIEYEKKEQRFLVNTLDTETKLDIIYNQNGLQFQLLPRTDLLRLLKSEDFEEFIALLDYCVQVIKSAISICKKRTKLLLGMWDIISDDLIEKIRSFEFKGLKRASNKLRVKLLPEISEMKTYLKQNMVEGTSSRKEVLAKLDDYIIQVKEDIFGELTDSQIYLLETLDNRLTNKELIDYISNDETRNDLVYLLKSGKIDIHLENTIRDLI